MHLTTSLDKTDIILQRKMTSTDDLDEILEGLSYDDLQALSDEIDPEV